MENAVPPVQCTLDLGIASSEGPESVLADLVLATTDLHEAVAASDCILIGLDLKVGPENIGPTLQAPMNVPGDQGETLVPANVSMLVRKTVPAVSARFAGRIFYPGAAQSTLQNAGTWNSSAHTQYQTAWTTFMADLVAMDVNPVILPKSSSDPRSVGSFDVQVKPATQRRRLRR